jgi:hypothetical protein
VSETTLTPVSGDLDPLGDADRADKAQVKRNRAKVGAARPSTLLYTYGPGAIMDLPQFTVMPAGLDDWDRIWARRDVPATIHAPRLLQSVRKHLGHQVRELRPFPWAPRRSFMSREGEDLGVPARVFPQWLRCTGCDLLAPLTRFEYTNTHPHRTDQARFEHVGCPGRKKPASTSGKRQTRKPALPARYLLVCTNGHLDEFPYDWWVHRGKRCPKAEVPVLKMIDRVVGKGASATIVCASCDARRPMNEAQGEHAAPKLPRCRARHPHLDAFDTSCDLPVRLILVGSSNLWFPVTQSIVVMPAQSGEETQERADLLLDRIARDDLEGLRENLADLRRLLRYTVPEVAALSDADLSAAVELALALPQSVEERREEQRRFDPVELLLPEWRYLQRDPSGQHHDDASGLTLSPRARHPQLRPEVSRVLAIDKLRKVNALVGFTRIDDVERIGDAPTRLAPLTRDRKPLWTVATEDRGEGIFLQLNEGGVAAWEARVENSQVWLAHVEAHRRNYANRYSETAAQVDPDTRLAPPRYWLVHTLAHVLIREMAMRSGYSAASISERLYAWRAGEDREAAAGLMLITTASDSDGTLGGLVQLSEPQRLHALLESALLRARRCSSDPVCAQRVPRDPEDFLHGAACHCCAMASETSCERANRFLDRRFLLDLPNRAGLGFFGRV